MKRLLQKILERIFGGMLECQCSYCRGLQHARAKTSPQPGAYQKVA